MIKPYRPADSDALQYLNANSTRQWTATAAIAEQWVITALPILQRFQYLQLGDYKAWLATCEAILREGLVGNTRKYPGSYLDFLGGLDQQETWVLDDPWLLGIASWSDKHLVKGDLVLLIFGNGTDRHPIWSVTSKGHRLNGYYYSTTRCDFRAMIELIEIPAEYVGQQPTEPDAQLFISSLRAG